MELTYEGYIRDLKEKFLMTSDNNPLYIPLHAKFTTNPEEESFDLADKLKQFFVFDENNTNNPKVMLLMGDTGSGKSVFSQQLYQQLWKHYKSGDPIPLWIPLPELDNPFESAAEEVLKKYGFDDSQITEMKAKERFIFLVDGYDELHQFQNCYVTNKWDKWAAKVLITCRSQALYYQKDPDKYFMPFNGERRLPQLLRRLHIAPFSKEQITAYVKQYQALHADHKILEEDFAKVPGLVDLMTTPFLLHCAVEALPEILASQVNDEKMTQAKLYDVFIERWFTRQVKKLSIAGLLTDTEAKTKQQFWDYCKRLAQQMHAKEVSVIPYQGQKGRGRLFGKHMQTTTWEGFFNEETEVLRSACPLKRVGNYHYGFVHASMIEYFATRAMYEEIQEHESTAQHNVIASEAEKVPQNISDNSDELPRKINQPRGGIHQRLFAKEKNSIRFIADRIEMSEAFKQKMLAVLEASKKSEQYAIGAANAITALVSAGVSFNGANLSGIKISNSDISGGYFDNADLSKTELSNVQMFHVWLKEANLENSHLDGINFGEYLWCEHENIKGGIDFRGDLQRVVIACGNKIVLWDINTFEQLSTFSWQTESKHTLNCVALSPDGKYVASGGMDNTVRICEMDGKKEILVFEEHTANVNCVSFNYDGKKVVSGSNDNTIRVWDSTSGKELAVLSGEGLDDEMSSITCVKFSPNGRRVVSASSDGIISIWEWNIRKKIIELTGHSHSITSVQFSPDGKRVVSGSWDETVRVWDLSGGKEIVIPVNRKIIYAVAFSPDGELVVAGNRDNTVGVWELRSRKQIALLQGHKGSVMGVAFTSDGKQILSGSEDKTVRVWDIASGFSPARSCGHNSSIGNVTFSLDGNWIISSAASDKRIWDVASGKEIALLREHKNIDRVPLSPNGKYVISGGNTLRIWEVWNWQKTNELNTVPKTGDNLIALGKTIHINFNSSFVVSNGFENTVKLWETSSLKLKAVLHGHEKAVSCVAFSMDGKRIVSGSRDNTVRIWDVEKGLEISSSFKKLICHYFFAKIPDTSLNVEFEDEELGNCDSIFYYFGYNKGRSDRCFITLSKC